MEKNARSVDRRRRRTKTKNRISLGQLAASVAYHYHLSPSQVAEFSIAQLMLWHRRSAVETGYRKLLDLEVELIPHTENPDRTLRNVRANLLEMTGEENGSR